LNRQASGVASTNDTGHTDGAGSKNRLFKVQVHLKDLRGAVRPFLSHDVFPSIMDGSISQEPCCFTAAGFLVFGFRAMGEEGVGGQAALHALGPHRNCRGSVLRQSRIPNGLPMVSFHKIDGRGRLGRANRSDTDALVPRERLCRSHPRANSLEEMHGAHTVRYRCPVRPRH